jgi:hypothetical protein
MCHTPFASLVELLAPETLSRLAGLPITSARRGLFVGSHSASGSSFLTVETNDGHGPRFVVKLSSTECDWIVRATEDVRGREVLVWESGLLDRLPPEITHPVIACARAREGWAILMHDVSDDLLADPQGVTPICEDDHRRYLAALAALHVAFWDDLSLAEPLLGYCSASHRYTMFSQATGERESAHPNEVVRWIRDGWAALWGVIEPDLAALLRELLGDPAPLCTAMARYPQTLLHGDPRTANLGITDGPPPRVILLDWHLVGHGTPRVDLAWYLTRIGPRVPMSNETSIACYRAELARRLGNRFAEQWWRPQTELSVLGEMLRRGWMHGEIFAHHPSASVRKRARKRLRWWCERAREGARWL